MLREPSNRLGQVLEGYAARTVSANANIWPSIAAKLGTSVPKRSDFGRGKSRPPFVPTIRPGWRISLALISVLVATVEVVAAYWGFRTDDVADSIGTIAPGEIEAQVNEYINRTVKFSGAVLIAPND